jgi:phage tail-like protein
MAIRAQVHVTGPGINRVFVLEEGVWRIGRDPVCEIRLDHPLLSAIHARLERIEDRTELTDLNSLRGTRLNGAWLEPSVPTLLQAGDEILLHPFRLAYTAVVVAEGLTVVEQITDDAVADELSSSPTPSNPDESEGLLPPSLSQPQPSRTQYQTMIPPGLSRQSIRYISYLPAIYQTDFVSRFLAMLEAIMMPVEWTVGSFDLFLHPSTAPKEFLPWLSGWFGLTFDPTWSEEKQRRFLQEAPAIFARRGTKWSLSRVLEIYTGRVPEILDLDEQEPFTFTVRLPLRERDVNRELIERMIQEDKPAHTSYKLEFAQRANERVMWSKLEDI